MRINAVVSGTIIFWFFLMPLVVSVNETYIFEDFSIIESLGDLRNDWSVSGEDSSFDDGTLFLRMKKESSSSIQSEAVLATSIPSASGVHPSDLLLFMGMEVRLRCSSDNMLDSDIGGGTRAWGFQNKGYNLIHIGEADSLIAPWFQIGFLSISEKTDWGPPGFFAFTCDANQVPFIQPIQGIDISEWHNYTILWRPNNGTFLVDGVVVATTPSVPHDRLRGQIWIDNDMMQNGTWSTHNVTLNCEYQGTEKICIPEYIQIDHILIYYLDDIQEPMENEISTLYYQSLELIDNITHKGGNTDQVNLLCNEAIQTWENDYSRSRAILAYLVNNMDSSLANWADINEMFARANSTINTARETYPDHEIFLSNWYSQAQKSWTNFEMSETTTCINWILNTTSWQEIANRFTQAKNTIHVLEEQGRTREAAISKGLYTQAEKSWNQHNYQNTMMNLEKIIAMPEQILSTILGIILPTILLRRKKTQAQNHD